MNSIEFFQFDNLVRNRVPFYLLNFSDSVTAHYTGIYKMHLQNWETLVTPENYLSHLTEKNLPKDFAIVLLSKDGTQSQEALKNLETKGYTNVFACEGGYNSWPTHNKT